MTLTSPGLSAVLFENFSCYLADNEDRFPPFVVSAIEVTPRTVFSCNIEGRVPSFSGMTAGKCTYILITMIIT